MTTFNELPQNIQNEVINTLGVYDRVSVYRKDDATLYTMVGNCLHTGKYDKLVGTYNAHEVLTVEQRILAYVKEAREFPWHCSNGLHYAGKKDWEAMNSDWTNVKLVDGNLVFS